MADLRGAVDTLNSKVGYTIATYNMQSLRDAIVICGGPSFPDLIGMYLWVGAFLLPGYVDQGGGGGGPGGGE